jgi:uncharacterized repeat protein (TIGR03803 family)
MKRVFQTVLSFCVAFLISHRPALSASAQFEQVASFGRPNSVGRTPGRLVRGDDGYLYGATSSGFAGGTGSIFRIRTNSTSPEILHQFSDDNNGFITQQDIIFSPDRMIYGWAHTPGSSTDGLLFRFSLADSSFTPLITAAQAKSRAWSELMEGSDGRLYAIAGPMVVRINPDGTNFQILATFTDEPIQLFEGSDGKLYVVSFAGIIYRMATDGTDAETVRDFTVKPVSGASSPHAVFEASDGFLYGLLQGIDDGSGPVKPKIFRLSRDGSDFKIIKELDTFQEGNLTYGNQLDELIEGPDGNLFGTVRSAGLHDAGYVFRLARDGSSFTKLFDFPGEYLAFDPGLNVNRNTPRFLVDGGDGFIYGTTEGSSTVPGYLYRFRPDGTEFTDRYRFNPPTDSGANPDSGVVVANDGSLYGVTRNGTLGSAGAVFHFDGELTGLKAFSTAAAQEGLNPSGITLASDGLLYGVTAAGGTDGFGTIFKIKTDGTGFATLRSFAASGSDGRVPQAALIEGTDKTLYGSTSFGGGAAAGTIFRINKDGSVYKVLARLTNALSGSNIVAALLEGADDRLYGCAVSGGPLGGGTVFSVEKSGATFRIVQAFSATGTALRNPKGALIQGPDGALYGTASAGGSGGFGGVFRLSQDNTGFRPLHEFSATGADGRQPVGALIFGGDGFLYGVTEFGGGAQSGSLYRLKTDGTDYEKLHGFSGNGDGINPRAGLALGGDGTFWGTTSTGGLPGFGTLFRLTFESAAPTLSILKADGNLIQIEWPSSSLGFRLESKSNLSDSLWNSVGSGTTIGDQFQVQVQPSAQGAFYRLAKP